MLRRALAFLAVAAVTAVLLTPICDVLHRCGCTLWSGLTHCNVQAVTGPHCPWCEYPVLGGISTALVVGGQLLVFGRVLRSTSIPGAAAAALVALPFLSVAAGALAWLPTDYPHFLVHDARARLGLPAGPLHCFGGPPHAH